LIHPDSVQRAIVITFGLAILVGVYLVASGGLPILLIGLASIAAGILYTGGPYPFGYYGLGDVFVFVFFGLVAVTGTYYVQAAAAAPLFPLTPPPDTIPATAVIASLPMAALITNILVVNNIRDLESDRAAGKHTLAVYLSYTGSRTEFIGLLVLAYLVPLWFVLLRDSLLILLPLVTLPYAVKLSRTVLTRTSGAALNPALEQTGRLTAAFALLYSIGLAA
jgi:1,4-dihydroxy-2-naphthoate octaprenyltransferase